jgi:hypothetical protein
MAGCWQLLYALLAAGILAAAGCGGGRGGGAASAPPPAAALYGVTQDNLQIATALYQDAARTPAGFYADPAPPGENYVATVHVKSNDVAASGSSFELCSDDWNQALQWSEAAAAAGGTYGNLVGNSSTARYFEFDRVRPGMPPLYLRQRIYLCGYLDRRNAVAGTDSGPAGTLNLRPIGAPDLRLLSEYLWRFTPWNNYGHAVLVSEADPIAVGASYTLVIATLVVDGTGPGCDRVDVEAWRHSVALDTGALVRALLPLWSFSARQGAAGAEACGA